MTRTKSNKSKGSARSKKAPTAPPTQKTTVSSTKQTRKPRVSAFAKTVVGMSKAMEKVQMADNQAALLSIAARSTVQVDPADKQEVMVQINPHLLYQFVFGFVSRLVSCSDNVMDYDIIPNVVFTYLLSVTNWANAGTNLNPVNTWPRQLIELGNALQAKNVGKYRYIPDFNPLRRFITQVTTNGYAANNLGSFPRYGTGPDNSAAAGLGAFNLLGTQTGVSIISQMGISCFFESLTNDLDLFTNEQVPPNENDASAFAFDVSAPCDISNNLAGITGMYCKIGYCYNPTTYSPLYLRQSSSVGLEVPIRTPWLARLRLGTSVPLVITNNTGLPSGITNDQQTGMSRRINYVKPVSQFPSVFGWAKANTIKLPTPIQLKPVSGSGILQCLLTKLETAFVVGGTLPSLQKVFSSQDLKYFSYALLKRALSPYSGVECGVAFVNGSTAYINNNYLGAHIGLGDFDSVRLPKPVSDFLSSVTASLGKSGTILPFIPGALNPWGLTVNTTSPGYTGTAIVGSGVTATEPQIGFFQSGASMVANWKSLEFVASSAAPLVPLPNTGESLLDCHFLISKGSGAGDTNTIVGALSRRPLTSTLLSRMYVNACAIGYDLGNAPITNTTGEPDMNYGTLVGTQYNREYNFPYYRSLANKDTVSSIGNALMYEGYVANGVQASNIVPVTNPPSSAGVPQPGASPLSSSSTSVKGGIFYRLGSMIESLRYGNYCGPGWTAGKSGKQLENLYLAADGSYPVPPIDKLDEACKRHDEFYARAQGNEAMEQVADRVLVGDLQKLGFAEKGTYGILAQLWFALPPHGFRRTSVSHDEI